jgi:tetratricopeptide (TPR) repeat protein
MAARSVYRVLTLLAHQAVGSVVFGISRLLGRDDWAIAWVSGARSRLPAFDVNFSVELSRYYERRDDVRSAEETLVSAVERQPRDGFAKAMLGDFLERQGRLSEAAVAFEAALHEELNLSERYQDSIRERLRIIQNGSHASEEPS